ncbi:myotubularin-related protein 8-like isoform X2 [Corticium candelabrum]|uniref:myotubularin-related protein 8-like isoform X2 n=1 Tax=Corticium candelabrum TaxID=121492 RepID=UPI002E263F7A|nr:myotubularin-related protein 8-like isoform X2 [Corticium candelabrum]
MEHISTPKIDDVHLQSKFSHKKTHKGSLYVTPTHLIFHNQTLLHTHILQVETLPLNTKGSPLKIAYKTFRSFTFIIAKDRECQDIYDTLVHFSRPNSYNDLYAFHYSPHEKKFSRENGWSIFHHKKEFGRMGIPNDYWHYSPLNENYKLCQTYPEWLYVPSSVSEEVVNGSAKFRSRERVPALSYYHQETQAALCRCSQPLSGMVKRSSDDETYLETIALANPNKGYMYVVDTRPRINAMANKAAGKGYENTNFYSKIEFHFLGIPNIHVMRDSLNKLVEVVSNPSLSMTEFLSGIASSGWLKHIRSVMETSIFIAKALAEQGRSVLVHCSDGWDRTAQTCSVASLLIDPYYRTLHGFQVLICKEWLAFGHKFTERCGHLDGDGKEISPVFLQFLEVVWQLQCQFPCTFQFNEKLLIDLHEHASSCQFGTFLGNCERERKELELSSRTYSFWGYVWEHASEYLNLMYRPMTEYTEMMLHPDSSPQRIRFWRGMYNHHDHAVLPRQSTESCLASIIRETENWRKEKSVLEQKIKALKKRLGYVDHEAEDSFVSEMKGGEDKSTDRMDIDHTSMADIDQSTSVVDDEDLDYHPVDSLEGEDKGGEETSAVTNEEISDEA